ncbi:MAG: hypothetical protein HY423_09405 [Candidatus Lambdaproteobacteria bacterium]|nr:hypothetical protein [Candidatus Lambdaproteobacteria bacterium]
MIRQKFIAIFCLSIFVASIHILHANEPEVPIVLPYHDFSSSGVKGAYSAPVPLKPLNIPETIFWVKDIFTKPKAAVDRLLMYGYDVDTIDASEWKNISTLSRSKGSVYGLAALVKFTDASVSSTYTGLPEQHLVEAYDVDKNVWIAVPLTRIGYTEKSSKNLIDLKEYSFKVITASGQIDKPTTRKFDFVSTGGEATQKFFFLTSEKLVGIREERIFITYKSSWPIAPRTFAADKPTMPVEK